MEANGLMSLHECREQISHSIYAGECSKEDCKGHRQSKAKNLQNVRNSMVQPSITSKIIIFCGYEFIKNSGIFDLIRIHGICVSKTVCLFTNHFFACFFINFTY